jgi:hypothetical protein
MVTFESKLHREIILFATKILEVVCTNPWEPNPLLRIWLIVREVDYKQIVLL